MGVNEDGKEQEEGLEEKARRAGARHMLLGFFVLLFLLFFIAWCSMPG